ncbi:MlaD family protein [bacterium]|jgi:phospholipid/cholesterol/gamma-HCH transport system substrate-binding protein|nr:MlaD family protein [bacterium]
MNEQRMQFAIGVVTLVSLIALASLVLWFGDFGNLLQSRRTYYILLDNGLGAEPGIPVRRAGIRIGEVRSVEYDDDESKVALTIMLEGQNYLRDGDEPSLKTQGFLGDTYLDISTNPEMRGKKDRAPIPEEATLQGRPLTDLSQAATEASTLAPNANETLVQVQRASSQWAGVGERANRIIDANERRFNIILQDTTEAIDRLNQTLESINNVLDPKTQENLKVTLENVRKSSDQLEPLIQSSTKAIDQITGTTAKLDEVAGNLQKATKPLAERSENTVKNLDESAASLNALLADLSTIVRQFKQSDGTIQRLITDPTVYQNIEEVTTMLADAIADLQPIMQDLSVFSDKIARHPGELGVQGVITRDAGLKEVPPKGEQGHGLFRR